MDCPCKSILVKGDNVLQIKFKSSVNVGNELAKKVAFKLPESPRSMVRKAQYQFDGTQNTPGNSRDMEGCKT